MQAVKALLYMHPALYGTVESPEWKTYLGRPALKLVSATAESIVKFRYFYVLTIGGSFRFGDGLK